MDLVLKFLANFGAVALAVMGAIVTFYPPSRSKALWLAGFIVVGVITSASTIWQSERQDAQLREELNGGTNYMYLHADQADLQNRAPRIRTWICTTGRMFDVAIHPFPFGAHRDDPAYTSIGGAGFRHLNGCYWSGIALSPGKYAVELEARNGLVMQTLEITAPEEGPFSQICTLKRGNESLATPQCR